MSEFKKSSRWVVAAILLALVIAGVVYVAQSRGRNNAPVLERGSLPATPPAKKTSYIDQAAAKLKKSRRRQTRRASTDHGFRIDACKFSGGSV